MVSPKSSVSFCLVPVPVVQVLRSEPIKEGAIFWVVAFAISILYLWEAKEVLLRKANLQTRVWSSCGRLGKRVEKVSGDMLVECIPVAVPESK